MTEFVRFNSAFEHKDEKTKKRTRYPAGWSGEVAEAIAEAARKGGAVPATEKAAGKASRALTAARKALADADAKLAEAPEADKAKAADEREKAAAKLAEVEASERS